MEHLKELVGIITKNKAKSIRVIGEGKKRESNFQKLYEGIIADKFADETEAANYFYPDSDDPMTNYHRLQRRLSKRLLNSLFFIDVNQPGFNEIQKAYYTCYKDFAALKILIGRAAVKTALPLAKNILKKAVKFEFTDLAVAVLSELRRLYATFEGDLKKFQKANDQLHEFRELWKAEILAEQFHLELIIHYVKSSSSKQYLEDKAAKYASILKDYVGKVKTQKFTLYAYLVFSLRYEIVNDYHNTLKVCQEAVRVFNEKKKLVSKTNLFHFYLKIVSCQIQLGNYTGGEQAVQKCLSLQEKGTFNWFKTLENYLILLCHSGQFQKAFETYLEAVHHQRFKNLPTTIIEQWIIYEAFIHYFISIKVVNPGLKKASAFGKFRISKFVNDVPVYSKDKRGANISILILQVLFLVQQKNYDAATERLERLKDYSHRYLRKDDTYRSNCFIHMLMQLPKAYYNKKAAVRKAKKYIDKLHDMPLEKAKQSGELELVPYEKLWEFVLASLKG